MIEECQVQTQLPNPWQERYKKIGKSLSDVRKTFLYMFKNAINLV